MNFPKEKAKVASVNFIDEIKKIDDELEKETVNEEFMNRYYELKKDVENRTIYYPTTILGVVAGVVSSFMTSILSEFSLCKILAYIGLFLLGVLVTLRHIIPKFQKEKQCILQPYKLRIMEEKIDKRNQNSTSPTSDKQIETTNINLDNNS